MKNLKIPKGQSESVYEVEQTTQWPKEKWPKEKSTKGQTTIYKTYIENYRSSNTNPTKNRR